MQKLLEEEERKQQKDQDKKEQDKKDGKDQKQDKSQQGQPEKSKQDQKGQPQGGKQSQPSQDQKGSSPSQDQNGQGNQPPQPDQGQQGQDPNQPPPGGGSGESKDPSQGKGQPDGTQPTPSPGDGKQPNSQNPADPSAGNGQPPGAPDTSNLPDQTQPRQRGDFQAQPSQGKETPPPPKDGEPGQEAGEAPEQAGKMSPAQAEALLNALKGDDARIGLDPNNKHRRDEPVTRIGKPVRLPGWRALLAGLCAAWFLAGGSPLRAAGPGNPTVTASLADPFVEAGQPTEYRIDVVGGRADRPPPAPEVPGLSLNFAGKSYSFQFDSSTLSKTDTTSYIYTVESIRAGRFVIPGQEVQINGQIIRTAPVTLTVGDGGSGGAANRQVFVELLIPKKTAYLGESLPVEVRTYFGVNTHPQITPDLVLNGEGFSVAKFTSQKDAGQQAVEGINYLVASAKSAITGLRIGTLAVGPVEVDPIVQLPRPHRRVSGNDPLDAFFNNPFNGMNLQQAQQIKLLSDPVPVEIKPLPPQGRPADFTGAIGQFRLEAEAEPRKAQTGDPVTVHLVLSGKGNFDRVNAPGLSDEQGLRTYPATARFKADDEVGLSGIKMFDQVVIADGPRTALPGYHFNYFDPGTGKYVQVDTPPIPVRIEGGSLATPTPASALAATQPAANATPRPTPMPAPRRAEDILFIRNDAGSLLARDAFRPVYRQSGFWLAQGGGLAALLGLGAVGFARTRTRDEAGRLTARRLRRQSELQRALQRAETGRREFYEAAVRLAQMRAAAASGQPDASPGVQEICRDRRLDPQTAGSVAEMFRRHDELAYSGGPAAREPVPPDERQGVLAVLETLGRNPRP